MKTKILIAVLSIGLFSATTVKAQETKQVQIKHEQMGITYTCPMHADVKSDKPGTCPKCGMELKKMDMSSTKMNMKDNSMMMDHSKMDMKMDSTKMNMKDNSMMMDHSKMDMKHDQMAKTYVCPMHPKVTSDKPGECAKCGMKMKTESTKTGEVTYACPMQCEGEKTYNKPGSCPKCNMDLKKMEMKKAEDTPENKSGHKNHKH